MAPVALIHDPTRSGFLAFESGRTLTAWRLAEVVPVLEAVHAAVESGLWAAGFLAYEAAPALDPTLAAWPPPPGGPPLAWFTLGPEPQLVSPPPAGSLADDAPLEWRPTIDRRQHARAVKQIRTLIARGDTYQVNLTFPLEAPFDGDPRRLHAQLWQAQHAPYAAWLDAGDWAVCSASPELFFRQTGDDLVARPMKGTSRRGRFPAEDESRRSELRSVKNRAENLMITDMTRNDLGRLARPGSVCVEQLFAEETYPTVHQLTSEISARTDASPMEVLRTLFPCASITGTPKRRATEIIRQLEAGPRGVYTGAIGWLAPGRRSQFSVAIRTVTIDRRRHQARYGTGGGIVWDSRPDEEFDECRAKALVLAAPRPRFDLLETLAWRPRRGFVRLEAHLDRLESSARYFGFKVHRQEILRRLDVEAASFEAVQHRVRLRLSKAGELQIDAVPWPCAGRQTWRFALDDRPVDEREPLLFHKTTHRVLYDDASTRQPGVDEVVLWNRHGRLTEGTRSNLVLRFGADFLTPPLEDGLLPGVYRQTLLDRGRLREAELPLSALVDADATYFINSLRGWVRGQLDCHSSSSSSAGYLLASRIEKPETIR